MTLFPNLLTVYNEALLVVGEKTINDHDNSAFAAVFRGVAENLAKRFLSQYNWDFARKEAVLDIQGEDERGDIVYVMPSDVLKIRRLHVNECKVKEYKVVGKSIISRLNNDALVLDYTYPADIDQWSPDFYDALRTYYEGLIRKSVLQDVNDGNYDMRMAKEMFIEANAREFNSNGNRDRNDGGKLLAARQGFGRHG